MAKRTHEKSSSDGVFLDPENVGSSIRYSTVAYKSNGRRAADAQVSLTDCNRVITWGGYGEEGLEQMLRKLGVAVKMLLKARAAVQENLEHYRSIVPAPSRRKS